MKTEFAWLIETDGPHYIHVSKIAGMYRYEWTRDASKALRFARKVDAEDARDGLREMYEELFKFPTHQSATAVEHGWDVHESGDHLVREQTAEV